MKLLFTPFFSLAILVTLVRCDISQLYAIIGCYEQPACVPLGTVYLANQKFALVPPIFGITTSFWNYLYGDVFAQVPGIPPCHSATKVLSLEWAVPVSDEGEAAGNNPPGFILQKVGWVINSTSSMAKYNRTLWLQALVNQYNSLADQGRCNWNAPWQLGVSQSIRNSGASCPVGPNCILHDLLGLIGFSNVTVSDISPPCDENARSNATAPWSVPRVPLQDVSKCIDMFQFIFS
jgi:hypothetical protein